MSEGSSRKSINVSIFITNSLVVVGSLHCLNLNIFIHIISNDAHPTSHHAYYLFSISPLILFILYVV